MQAREADIKHRLEMCKKQQGTLLPVLLDVEYLLEALQEARTENEHARTVNRNIRENNKKLRGRERVLREALEQIANNNKASIYDKDENEKSETYGEYVVFDRYEYMNDGKTAWKALQEVKS